MENWKEITGYEGYYEVSDMGRVRSKQRVITKSNGVVQTRAGKIKSVTETPDGYLYVKLSKNGSDKRIGIHTLVAREFVDGFQEGLEVNHKDYNRKNNRADNLEWLSHTDNIAYTIMANRHVTQILDMSGEHNPNFGNTKLHEKYSHDKALSKQKQSRPGVQNGRSRPVTMIGNNGEKIDFPYISECAKYLISIGASNGKNVSGIAAYISMAASKGNKYLGYSFSFI